MKILWLFQSGAFGDEEVVQRLAYAAEELGDEVRKLPYRPFGWSEYEDIDKDIPVVGIGSINFLHDIQRKIPNIPGVWADWPSLECSFYYTKYPDTIVQRHWCMFPYGMLGHKKDYIYHQFSDEEGLVFVRPNRNTKRFTGQLVHKNAFDSWYNYVSPGSDPGDIVIVSKPEVISREWRIVVYNGVGATGSLYMVHGSLLVDEDVPERVYAFVRDVCRDWYPHALFVMDVGELEDGTLRIVEIGSFNCAGLYASDVRKVARIVHMEANHDWEKYRLF